MRQRQADEGDDVQMMCTRSRKRVVSNAVKKTREEAQDERDRRRRGPALGRVSFLSLEAACVQVIIFSSYLLVCWFLHTDFDTYMCSFLSTKVGKVCNTFFVPSIFCRNSFIHFFDVMDIR